LETLDASPALFLPPPPREALFDDVLAGVEPPAPVVWVEFSDELPQAASQSIATTARVAATPRWI
jgi:hypothetical protein